MAEKISYALGLGIGQQLKSMNIQGFSIDAFTRSIAQVLNGESTAMTAREAQELLNDYFASKAAEDAKQAIAGAGILKAILSLLSSISMVDSADSLYQILFQGADAALYFLPVMVGCTMATKLGINRLVAIAVTGATILPNITAMLAEGTTVFGLQLQSIAYSYQVFPAMLAVGLLYFVERFFTKISPKAIRVFFVPMMCFLIVVPVTLMFLGPLGYNIGQVITAVILFLYDKLGWIAVALLASILPFMISMGMHKALLPYAVGAITTVGEELLYMPASLAHNIAEGGACFGVALKTKDEDLRGAAISSGISAIFLKASTTSGFFRLKETDFLLRPRAFT